MLKTFDKLANRMQVSAHQAPIWEIRHLSKGGDSIWFVFKASPIHSFELTMDQETCVM